MGDKAVQYSVILDSNKSLDGVRFIRNYWINQGVYNSYYSISNLSVFSAEEMIIFCFEGLNNFIIVFIIEYVFFQYWFLVKSCSYMHHSSYYLLLIAKTRNDLHTNSGLSQCLYASCNPVHSQLLQFGHVMPVVFLRDLFKLTSSGYKTRI